MKQANT